MNPKLSQHHDKLVEHVARQLKRRFYDDIRARIPGYRVPCKVNCAASGNEIVPDLTMVAKGVQLNVLEVETEDTLQSEPVERKWQALANHAAESGGRFWVVVPKEVRDAALDMMHALQVDGKVWELQPEESD